MLVELIYISLNALFLLIIHIPIYSLPIEDKESIGNTNSQIHREYASFHFSIVQCNACLINELCQLNCSEYKNIAQRATHSYVCDQEYSL